MLSFLNILLHQMVKYCACNKILLTLQKSLKIFVLLERSCFLYRIIHIKYIHYSTGRNMV